MKWLLALACALTLRDSVAFFWKKKAKQFYNLHCTFENVNELVCFVDVLDWEAKEKELYEKNGVDFCGAFTT